MARVTYVQPNGDREELDVPTGLSVMKAAIDNGVPGIIADCGGAVACATCTCTWKGRLPSGWGRSTRWRIKCSSVLQAIAVPPAGSAARSLSTIHVTAWSLRFQIGKSEHAAAKGWKNNH